VALEVDEPREARADALSKLVSEEERLRVRAALLTLSASDRDVLYWSFYEGLAPQEIATRHKKSAVTCVSKVPCLRKVAPYVLWTARGVTMSAPHRQLDVDVERYVAGRWTAPRQRNSSVIS